MSHLCWQSLWVWMNIWHGNFSFKQLIFELTLTLSPLSFWSGLFYLRIWICPLFSFVFRVYGPINPMGSVMSSTFILIVLGFNDTSTLVGHFVSSPKEKENRHRRDSRRDERKEQGRKRNRNENYLQYSLRKSSTVLASRMNFFNFLRFYYVVFAWILRKFRADFAWSFFLYARDFFSVARGFRAWTDVSTHDTITSPQTFFSAKKDFFFRG